MDEVQDPDAPELDRYHHRRKSDHRRENVPCTNGGGDLLGSAENLFGHAVSPGIPARPRWHQMKRSAGYPIAITVVLRIDMNQATGSSLVPLFLHEMSQSKTSACAAPPSK